MKQGTLSGKAYQLAGHYFIISKLSTALANYDMNIFI